MRIHAWIDARMLSAALVASCLASPIATAADIKNGEQLARRWCSTCHLVAADQSQANADVPSFASIAARPGFKSESTAAFLLDPHPKMPGFALSRKETDDIAEYIASLAGKQRKFDTAPGEKKSTL